MDIKKLLYSTLSNKSITDLLNDKKVYFLHATSAKPPYLEYEVISEFGSDWSENKEKFANYIIQVDIFSKGDYTTIESEVKKQLLLNGFKRDMAMDLYEEETQLFHKVMRFNIDLLNE